MKTRSAGKPRTKKAKQMSSQPQDGPSHWKTAAPLRIGNHSNGEWSPGASAKRGYERAVEDWWWI